MFAPLLSQPVLGDIATELERNFVAVIDRMVDPQSSPELSRFLAGALMATIRQYVADGGRRPGAVVAAEIGGYFDTLLTTGGP